MEARSESKTDSASQVPKKSVDPLFVSVSAPLGLEEAHGLQHFVPGAGAVGHINMTDG